MTNKTKDTSNYKILGFEYTKVGYVKHLTFIRFEIFASVGKSFTLFNRFTFISDYNEFE